MKLVCTQENLKRAIYNCEKVVAKQNTLPILNNILFDAEKSGLKLSATNLEIGVVVKIGAKVEKEGKVTIPAKLIGSFCNNLPSGETVDLEMADQSLKLKSNGIKASIKGLSATDFPLIPKKSTEFLLNIPISDLKSILSKVMVSVALNEVRQELTGVNIILEEKELLFASTDSFRLSECKFNLNETNCNQENYQLYIEKRKNIIVPANTLLELNRIISSEESGEVKIAIEEGQIFFEFNGVRLVSRLINGKYPEYKHILPPSYAVRVVGEKSALLGAVRMASIFTTGKTNEISLKIDSENGNITIGARSVEVGENSSTLNFDITGPSQELILNAKYFLEGINTISSSQVAILVNSASTPVALREIKEDTGEVIDKYTYILMPIKS